jgi:hypothetical protein
VKVAFHLAEPAGETEGVGEGRPQVVDNGVEPVFETYDARAVRGRLLGRAGECAEVGDLLQRARFN